MAGKVRLLGLLLALGCGGLSAGAPSSAGGGAAAGESGQACPGVATPTPDQARCRDHKDCAPDQWCQSRPPSNCGPPFPTIGCASDADCSPEQRCVEVGAPSCSGQGRSRGCAAPCPETACEEGDVCNPDGHCYPEPCGAGFACPVGDVCAPGMNADPHGCRTARCDSDEFSCPDGFACLPGDQADVHGCAPLSCQGDYTCPVNERCGAGPSGNYGCETLTCARDADCDCGYCIMGRCSQALYYCAKPPIG